MAAHEFKRDSEVGSSDTDGTGPANGATTSGSGAAGSEETNAASSSATGSSPTVSSLPTEGVSASGADSTNGAGNGHNATTDSSAASPTTSVPTPPPTTPGSTTTGTTNTEASTGGGGTGDGTGNPSTATGATTSGAPTATTTGSKKKKAADAVQNDTTNADQPTTVTKKPTAQRALELRAPIMNLLAGIVRWVGVIFAVILVVHIVLVIGEANPASGITTFVTNFADAVSLGFKNLFMPADPKLQVLVNYGIAAVFWLVVSAIIARLLRRLA